MTGWPPPGWSERTPFRLIITGSRWWDDEPRLFVRLDDIRKQHGPFILIHGGAKGADTLAHTWAGTHGNPYEAFPITREDWKKYKKAAGPRRNTTMVNAGANLCVAFPLIGSIGTIDCLTKAHKAGIPVLDGRTGNPWKFDVDQYDPFAQLDPPPDQTPCACACGTYLHPNSPSEWFATPECQTRWHNTRVTKPDARLQPRGEPLF